MTIFQTATDALHGLTNTPAITQGTQLFASATVCTAVRQGADRQSKIADLKSNIALLGVLLNKLESEQYEYTHGALMEYEQCAANSGAKAA